MKDAEQEGDGQPVPYEEMLDWDEEVLEDVLDQRAGRLQILVKSLQDSQKPGSVLPSLIGVVVMGILSLASIVGALFPEIIGAQEYSRNIYIPATVVSPFVLYGLYAVYSSYRSMLQRRELVAQYISEAVFLLDFAQKLRNSAAHGQGVVR